MLACWNPCFCLFVYCEVYPMWHRSYIKSVFFFTSFLCFIGSRGRYKLRFFAFSGGVLCCLFCFFVKCLWGCLCIAFYGCPAHFCCNLSSYIRNMVWSRSAFSQGEQFISRVATVDSLDWISIVLSLLISVSYTVSSGHPVALNISVPDDDV